MFGTGSASRWRAIRRALTQSSTMAEKRSAAHRGEQFVAVKCSENRVNVALCRLMSLERCADRGGLLSRDNARRRTESELDRNELSQTADELVHVVVLGEAGGEEDALVVFGGDDQVVVTVGEVAAFLRLVAGDDDLGADAFAEESGASG